MIHIVGSSNGRTTDFDSVNLGSSPSPTATLSVCTNRLELPGALIKFFVKNISLEKICSLIKENRKAKTITCIVFFDGEKEIIAKGETKGSIALKPRGNNGFGWDPIFIPEGIDKTFAELTSEEKQSKFMRQEAIAELRKKLIT
jgi:non-canonical purine NTP pyrophosphatase (RdgB/HAM1 family)